MQDTAPEPTQRSLEDMGLSTWDMQLPRGAARKDRCGLSICPALAVCQHCVQKLCDGPSQDNTVLFLLRVWLLVQEYLL